jgi:hypothetical protein
MTNVLSTRVEAIGRSARQAPGSNDFDQNGV